MKLKNLFWCSTSSSKPRPTSHAGIMRNEIEKSFLVLHITKKQDQLPAILLHRNALKCWEVNLYVKVTEKPITDFYYDVPQTA